jgi:hypothetical protein
VYVSQGFLQMRLLPWLPAVVASPSLQTRSTVFGLRRLVEDMPPPHFVPVWPQQSASFAASVAFVACGFDHSVLLLSTGALFAWGCNSQGQLGASALYLPFSRTPR